MDDVFLTISKISEGIYKEKGSKFISFAMPVSDVDEIKDILFRMKKDYYDARHICFAYRLGFDKTDFRYNDDGEPSGTAGKPIFGQILSNDLTDILVVVVRYFGGVKLGTGGLIVAYKEAAASAILNNEIITKTVNINLSFSFDYIFLNEVMRVVKERNVTILNQHFDNNCTMSVAVRKSEEEKLLSQLLKIDSFRLNK